MKSGDVTPVLYHGVDDIAERINPQGVADVGGLVMSTAVQLAIRATLLPRGTRTPPFVP